MLVATIVSASWSTAALARSYEFVQLQARSNLVDGYNLPPLSSFNSRTPDLNEDGTIAFSLLVVGGGPAGLFIGAGGVGEVVYSAPSDLLLDDPSINVEGHVAVELFDVFSEGIQVYDPTTGETTLQIPPTSFNSAAGVTIDDAGRIGFRAGDFSGRSWVVTDDEGSVPAAWTEESGGIAYLFTPSFDGAHGIAGKARLGSTANDSPDELRLYDAPNSFSVLASDVDADGSSPYGGFDNSIALASDGRVAFIASLVRGGRGVFLTDGLTTWTIATTNDAMVSDISFFAPAVNGSGLVAFRGTDGDGLDAIFAGTGTRLVRVIGEHDLVNTDLGPGRIDQHDGSVTFGGAVAINESGDIAFNATLTPADDDQIEWGSGMFIAFARGPGDVNGDGVVDVRDVLLVLAAWGACNECPEDLDGNGFVDVNDLLEVLANWS